jgi:predicted nucleic acid-binding Zn ribbon protein
MGRRCRERKRGRRISFLVFLIEILIMLDEVPTL